jgi:YVTN family beta-propeller protein
MLQFSKSVCVRHRRLFWRAAACFTIALAIAILYLERKPPAHAQNAPRFAGATSSQPLAVTVDGTRLLVANPDNNSFSMFDVTGDANVRVAEVRVGQEPSGVAVLPDGSRAFVANTVSGTVSALALRPRGARLLTNIPVGTEPYGVVSTPNGTKIYVSCARSNDIYVIDPGTNRVLTTIPVPFEPRGMAITNNGDDDDSDETLVVTSFLALPVPTRVDGEDDSKLGLVTAIAVGSDSILGPAILRPIADTGFLAEGDAIARIPPGGEFIYPTGAYPNQLNNIGIKGGFAFIPATGSSPNGPVRFDVNTQSLLAVIDISRRMDANRTINMHTAVRDQENPNKLFITQPWAMAIKNNAWEGYVVSAASNIVVKVAIDPDDGTPSVQYDPSDPTRVLQIRVGKNPRGIVVNSDDSRAYVMNYVSRDVSVIDLTASPESVMATLRSADLPEPGSKDDLIQAGKELFHTSIGEFDSPAGVGRMSRNGWGACSTCHPFGLTDNVVWIFAAGPRRAISLHTDFDITDPSRQRSLNWSAIFDEEEDFELNIRGVSGGLGILVAEDGVTQDMPVAAFVPPNGGRRQARVRGIGGWDAIKAYIQLGIRPPISPVSKTDPDVIAGEQIFRQNNCQLCHGGRQWTSANINFTPPPDPARIVNTELIDQLRRVGTFDPMARNEVRANAATPLGADGFAPASLLSLFAYPQTFFHNGQVDSLDAVMSNVAHRSAGTKIDLLGDPEDRRKLIRFLLSIDGDTPPVQ